MCTKLFAEGMLLEPCCSSKSLSKSHSWVKQTKYGKDISVNMIFDLSIVMSSVTRRLQKISAWHILFGVGFRIFADNRWF